MTPAEQEAEWDKRRPLPFYADRRFIAGLLGIATAIGCAFAPPALQGPCHIVSVALQAGAGSQVVYAPAPAQTDGGP